MSVYRTDHRLNEPLAVDLVADAAALYDRAAGPLTAAPDPIAEIDQLTTMLPYLPRIADVTRLVAALLAHLREMDGSGVEDVLTVLVWQAGAVTGSLPLRGTVGSLLLVAGDVVPAAPLAVRDQFLLPPEEFTALPERLTGPLFGAAVIALRVVTEHAHEMLRSAGPRGDLLRDLLPAAAGR